MFNFQNLFWVCFGREQRDNDESYTSGILNKIKKYLLFAVYLIYVFVNHVFFLLDEVLFFYYRFCKIEKPVMIIGLPRSGTTLLFRTLAEDKTNFTTFTLAEILFAPALSQKFLLFGLYKLDSLFGGPLRIFAHYLQTKSTNEYSKIHGYDLFKAEEDELLLFNIFSTAILKYFFPSSPVFDKYIGFDDLVSDAEKQNIFRFTERCIKKHIFFWKTVSGKQRTFLSKNPIFSPKIKWLFHNFKDLRVINTRRGLDAVIPSFASMNAAIINNIHHTKLRYPGASVAKKVILAWKQQVTVIIEKQDPQTYFICNYEDFTKDISRSIIQIYSHFKYELKNDFRVLLELKSSQQLNFKSKHKYDTNEISKALEGN